MTYSIYALLSKESPEINLALLQEKLSAFFSRTDEANFTFELEEDPFDADEKNILLTWDDKWWIRFFYDVGADVASDSSDIAKMIDASQAMAIENIDRRISVIFGEDKSLSYTNHIIYTIDFLQDIPGVFVFDLLKKCLL